MGRSGRRHPATELAAWAKADKAAPVIPLGIPPHTRHCTTRPHQLDGAPDLSSEDGIPRDGVDGRGPWGCQKVGRRL
jgi:hypothetical protein